MAEQQLLKVRYEALCEFNEHQLPEIKQEAVKQVVLEVEDHDGNEVKEHDDEDDRAFFNQQLFEYHKKYLVPQPNEKQMEIIKESPTESDKLRDRVSDYSLKLGPARLPSAVSGRPIRQCGSKLNAFDTVSFMQLVNTNETKEQARAAVANVLNLNCIDSLGHGIVEQNSARKVKGPSTYGEHTVVQNLRKDAAKLSSSPKNQRKYF